MSNTVAEVAMTHPLSGRKNSVLQPGFIAEIAKLGKKPADPRFELVEAHVSIWSFWHLILLPLYRSRRRQSAPLWTRKRPSRWLFSLNWRGRWRGSETVWSAADFRGCSSFWQECCGLEMLGWESRVSCVGGWALASGPVVLPFGRGVSRVFE